MLNVYKLNEITDSKIQYDKKPPRFMYYIILVMLMLVVSFFIWSTKSIKTYIVTGNGIVTTENKSNITAKVSGEVKEVYIQEGKEVKAGDILIVFNSPEPKYQIEQVENQVEFLNKRIDLLKRAENEANKGTNTFDKNNIDELEFYNRLLGSNAKLEEYKVDEEALRKQGYKEAEIKQFYDKAQIKKNQIYYDTILSFTNERNQLEMEKDKLETQKKAIANSMNEYIIYAVSDGKIHLNSEIKKGMVLQSGSQIGSIAKVDGELTVEALISGSDRPRVQENDEVSLAIDGLNQAEYRTLNGNIESIDEDATIDNQKGKIYFKVKIRPDNNYIEDKNGDKVKLKLGMVTEVRVKYEKITYMKYFMEQIGIKGE
ncbi:HlyD family secretion protein [Clostridium cellulovorans]|uniref:Biotin/lipoyl attachment domain-containing protein n=1 Tax=Clostridium cellulovorans (strain ATCC 35296 / DSM 3052 / OCM 3 / 743B) TaxID=573061 RepID=D9SW37_CLOC7|nr:efflux RND transporter periplasmic adaptor subunit [Clostridium cellulovorans]ADL51181.1 biotin/lipoyl attachment domain-containing protein [Clostridium cellulovorans 743B]